MAHVPTFGFHTLVPGVICLVMSCNVFFKDIGRSLDHVFPNQSDMITNIKRTHLNATIAAVKYFGLKDSKLFWCSQLYICMHS